MGTTEPAPEVGGPPSAFSRPSRAPHRRLDRASSADAAVTATKAGPGAWDYALSPGPETAVGPAGRGVESRSAPPGGVLALWWALPTAAHRRLPEPAPADPRSCHLTSRSQSLDRVLPELQVPEKQGVTFPPWIDLEIYQKVK